MKILDRLPLLPHRQNVRFGQRNVAIHRDSLLVWLSVGLAGEESPQRISPPFPALLDSGNTCEAFLHEHHLVHWAGIRPELLGVLDTRRINEQNVPFLQADLWIYPNVPGTHERDSNRPPYRLEFEGGLAVGPPLPDHPIFPRVPLLGLAALRENALDFWFDSNNGQCFLRTADWRSRIIRFLCRFL